MCSAIHNIAVECEIITINEIHNFGTLCKSNFYVTLLLFYYCNLLQLQVTEKSNLLPATSLLVTSF